MHLQWPLMPSRSASPPGAATRTGVVREAAGCSSKHARRASVHRGWGARITPAGHQRMASLQIHQQLPRAVAAACSHAITTGPGAAAATAAAVRCKCTYV